MAQSEDDNVSPIDTTTGVEKSGLFVDLETANSDADPKSEAEGTAGDNNRWRVPLGRLFAKSKAPARGLAKNTWWLAVRRHIIPLVPIPATIAVATLNFAQVFVLDLKNQSQNTANQIRDGLQFAASIYGSLMFASVSAIVLQRIQYELAKHDSRGISLGSLVTSYQLNTPKTLFAKEFWSGLRGDRSHLDRWQRYSLIALFVWAIFVANAAQSFAAIAIIPKINWYPVPFKTSNPNSDLDSYTFYIVNDTTLWPTVLDDSALDPSCLTSNALSNASCPAGGYSSITETLSNWNSVNLGFWNVTIFNDDISRVVGSFANSFNTSDTIGTTNTLNSTGFSYSSSVGQVLSRSLKNYLPLLGGSDWMLTLSSPNLLAPSVAVNCTYSTQAFTGTDTLNDTAANPIEFAWEDRAGHSIGAEFRLKRNDLSGLYVNFSDTFSCSVDAYWVPVKPSMSPLSENVVTANIAADNVTMENLIYIDPGWAQALNVQVQNSSARAMELLIDTFATSINNISLALPNYSDGDFLSGVSAGLGLVITDGLSRVGSESLLFLQGSDSEHPSAFLYPNGSASFQTSDAPKPEWTKLKVTAYRYGYRYSASTITVKLALAFFFLHALIAILHVLLSCITRKPWANDKWADVGQLFALALSSSPSGGHSSAKKWQQSVKVRQAEEGRIEIVVVGKNPNQEEENGHAGQKSDIGS